MEVLRRARRTLGWYRSALANLGVPATLRLQAQRRLRRPAGLMSLTSRLLAHPVLARVGSSDLDVFNQIFVEREYRCLDRVEDPALIVDLGANVGYSSAYFLSRFPRCRVVAVEPHPGNFALMKRNVAAYGGRCRAIHAAVWPRREPLRFKPAKTTGEEWGYEVERAAAADADRPIETVTMPMLLADSARERISILKVDIEGAEYELFGGEPAWVEQVDNIAIELHGERCRAAFLAAVERRHYAISTCGELTVCLRAP